MGSVVPATRPAALPPGSKLVKLRRQRGDDAVADFDQLAPHGAYRSVGRFRLRLPAPWMAGSRGTCKRDG